MALLRWRLLACLVLAGLFTLLVPSDAPAECPFCDANRGPTLIDDFKDSSMVLYGQFVNPKPNAGGGIQNGTTEFVIEKVLKDHDIIKGKTTITLPVFIPTKSTFLLFCDVFNGTITPLRGEEVLPPTELLAYLDKALKVKDEPTSKRLRLCFDYLNSTDSIVSMDAYREFAKADYADYKDMAKSLPAKVVAEWLEDPKTEPYRYGLYASLLGHCGDRKIHGGLLRSMLDDPKKRQNSSIDGLMAGYVMLQPDEAWEFMHGLLKNDDEDFNLRFAVLTTMRFFWETRTDLVSQQKILKSMRTIIDIPDISDFAIDNMRVWQAWSMTDPILDLFTKESHDNVVVKRAILRFALSSPSPRAAAFVRAQRQRDPVWVGEMEEFLRDVPLPLVPVEKGGKGTPN